MRKASEKPLLALIETSEVNDPHFTAPSIEIESGPDESQRETIIAVHHNA